MAKRYSIVDIRNRLSEVVHEAEKGEEITLTRRGKPVAVMLSCDKYARLRGKSVGFWSAYQGFRKMFAFKRLGVGRDVFAGLRDRGQGRDVNL
ncbi:MAG: type II toxin-antitoxin system Phd/YefM family antitoxin [Sulfuricaulis sp.]|nr:type II toxin-antitoxin system Phd/YefM family antitoxin [Sulfuricaulis sp.]